MLTRVLCAGVQAISLSDEEMIKLKWPLGVRRRVLAFAEKLQGLSLWAPALFPFLVHLQLLSW